MFAQQASNEPTLRECPDRRRGDRFVHLEPVQVDGRLVAGRDISSRGLSVVMQPRVSVGEYVHVTLTGVDGLAGMVTTPARVARVATRADRFVVGLEFVK